MRFYVPFAVGTLLGLAACGSGSGGMAQVKMSVGDAPVDGAQAVVVKFTGVELTANSGNPVDITFAQPKTIDLLNQSGTASAVLFDQPIPSGSSRNFSHMPTLHTIVRGSGTCEAEASHRPSGEKATALTDV